MFTKRSIIVILAGLNLMLLAALFWGSYSLPTAYAQSASRGGDFVCVTAKVRGRSFDAVYLLDRQAHRLHTFYPSSIQTKKYAYGQSRDLKKDFGK